MFYCKNFFGIFIIGPVTDINHWLLIDSSYKCLEMVFCYQNCSDLIWEEIVVFSDWEKLLKFKEFAKLFEITETICLNSERLENFW